MLFVCQGAVGMSLQGTAKRRRRDLNPRAAVNDLHPFQGCPFGLLGTSPNKLILNRCLCIPVLLSGESGIRTHAPLRTNGFQDRLVMTTSISLQACRSLSDLSDEIHSTKNSLQCQQLFSNFVKNFFRASKPLILSLFRALAGQKTAGGENILRGGYLNILVGSLHQFYRKPQHLFHHHGIVCDRFLQ